ncbi:efflux RND transporter periplasmic adaptor subunit [Alteromonas stellipolaris]|uniref:efflux RND transporter periplasmic adaptor subunit n=1 Tax=Alteromonas stellipolaris TaxID=233316 RepID=UPI001E1ABA69|nr:efflux RND transporter periplasmic adaptor subunit [Alteromonas stellipolaris]MBZ2160668.1 efflux RND transporter periplasmic adaptor subunit [Alteromonas stellipolaris]MDO6535127.1 efflux RND transporter periplasmic adaptor subunit [Alteromonas stellipolaris]MDO6626963.1 efflux RND transporter periplasmic adaptor subunit [Alteromonas stellipolaris]
MKRVFYVITTLALLVGAIGCSSESEQAGAGQKAMPPQSVSVLTMARQSVTHEMILPGRVTPSRQSQVRPQVDGVITERLFEEGAQVEKGQQLYQIDDARYRAQLNSTIADVKSAEANLKTLEAKARRYDDLIKKNAISRQEYDDVIAQKEQAQAAIIVAEAAVDLARVNLGYTKVYAPISGRISRSFVTEGTLATTNQTQQLATITQLNPIFIDMQESGRAILTLRQAMQKQGSMPVELTLDEATGKKYEHTGSVKFSEVTVDESTGSVALRAEMPNPDGLLLPGLFVKGHVITGTEQALLVPQRATMRQQDGSLSVYVVNSNDEVEVRALKTSDIYKDQYIATSGIKEGDRLIVSGYQKVKPGSKVNTSEWQSTSRGSR